MEITRLGLLVFLNIFLFSETLYASFEALQEKDKEYLIDTGKKTRSSKADSGEDIKIYEFDQDSFDKIFPHEYVLKVASESDIVGQITDVNGEGRGTGFCTSIEFIEEEGEKSLRVTGVSAFHTFCTLGAPEKRPLIIKKDYCFQLGKKAILNDTSFVVPLAIFNINKVNFNFDFQNEASFAKDICLFQGKLDPQSIHISIVDLQKRIEKKLPSFLYENQLKSIQKGCHCTVYHYPAGRGSMRKNDGVIETASAYKVSTLEGSSGAPLFLSHGSVGEEGVYIIGIHRGAISIQKNQIAYLTKKSEMFFGLLEQDEYEAECDFSKDDLHAYEEISREEYDRLLRKSFGLYSLTECQKIKLQISFLRAQYELEASILPPALPANVINKI